MNKGLAFRISLLIVFNLWSFSRVFANGCLTCDGDSLGLNPDSTASKTGFLLQLSSQHFLMGNALNVDFFKTFVQGGTWNTDKNQRVLNNLSFSNRSFFQSKSEFSFTELRQMDNEGFHLNWRFQVGDQQYGHARFSGDLFRLVFNGNSDYLGDTLRIGQNELERQRFRYFGIGLASANALDYCMLSYVDGIDFYRMRWNQGSFYTSAWGDSIAVDANLHQLSNASDRKGVGFKLDARKSYVGNKYSLVLDVFDLGWVKWNDLEKEQWNIHETYSGVQWIDWIKVSDPLGQNIDRWTTAQRSGVSKWMALPTSIRMQGAWQVIKNWTLDYSFQRCIYQNQQGYRCVSIQRKWQRYSLTRPDLLWRMSGYQSLTRQYWVGSDFGWSWFNGMSVHLQTYQLLSPMVKARKQFGFGISLQYLFKGSSKPPISIPKEDQKNEQQYFQF
jgi:hypothetical protein